MSAGIAAASARARAPKLPLDEALRITREVADGLESGIAVA